MKSIKIFLLIIFISTIFSCKKYLDIVPDNIATIEYAFRMRSTAEKYLFTCYSFMPKLGNMYQNPALFGGDDLWLSSEKSSFWLNWAIARGDQNVNNPLLDYWNGSNGATALWMGISQCNIFLENISKVPDINEMERAQWVAEVKFLKAYYHFFLLRMYGPIPVMKTNFPISASGEEIRVYRKPVDEVFNYIIELIDEASEYLTPRVKDENSELGRITLPIALGMKAKILVYAASPLFNGNDDYANFTNKDGSQLFNTQYSEEKWQKAVEACKEAIDLCHSLNYKLYEFEGTPQTMGISNQTQLKMNARGTITDRWNQEIIWANSASTTQELQIWSAPRVLEASHIGTNVPNGSIGVTMKIVDLFYSKNGVPTNEDVGYNSNDRLILRTSTAADKYMIKEGYTTVNMNFDRESRFYATLGFDGGVWYGQGRFDDNNPYWLEIKKEQMGGKVEVGWHSVTGYYAKKYVHYTNVLAGNDIYTSTDWPWVELRLGDLYLLYAEALNELYGPTNDDIYYYLDMIRAKAGLRGIKNAWATYSNKPSKPNTKDGLREIIRQERNIELALEGNRFWDLRRWKEAPLVYNSSIKGWDVDQVSNEAYYREKVLFSQEFSLKDYFWPIREYDLIVNKNLVQNPGW